MDCWRLYELVGVLHGDKRDGEMVGQRDKEQKGGQAGTQHACAWR